MNEKTLDTITIKNADLGNTNFTGDVMGKYGKEEKRYIIVRLNPDVADDLRDAGWHVKTSNPSNPEYEPYSYIKVRLNFDGFYFRGLRKRTKIYQVTKNNKILLNEETVKGLEGCYFEKVDLKIDRIYYKTYDQYSIVLDTGFFTIEPDELYDEYFSGPNEPIIDDEEDNPFM